MIVWTANPASIQYNEIQAPNDTSGNPRRGVDIIIDGSRLGFLDMSGLTISDRTVSGMLHYESWQVRKLGHYEVTSRYWRTLKEGPQARRDDPKYADTPTAANEGVWLSEANRGWRLAAGIVQTAWGFGMPHTDHDVRILTAFLDENRWDQQEINLGSRRNPDMVDVAEAVTGQREMADTAEEWLNTHIAPDGYSFGPLPDVGGDWGLWKNDDEEGGGE